MLIRGDGISVVFVLALTQCQDSFISGHSRNACDATSPWLHADRDFILQGDHRHVVLIIEGGKKSFSMGTQMFR